jgi:ATP-binding cassette, subfamily C (CFTR/MRP), member 1
MLLLSLLGETTRTTGEYAISDNRVAYVQQDALILPGTIRENILFGRTLNEARYRRVLEACALPVDLKRLPNGDGTLLNSKGGTLSGGQRQRIVRNCSLQCAMNL